MWARHNDIDSNPEQLMEIGDMASTEEARDLLQLPRPSYPKAKALHGIQEIEEELLNEATTQGGRRKSRRRKVGKTRKKRRITKKFLYK